MSPEFALLLGAHAIHRRQRVRPQVIDAPFVIEQCGTSRPLRQQIAVVTQEPILFNDSVRNNIAYGRLDATEPEIIEAAKAAYAYDFIKGFSDGFNTSIGELGGRLSGGPGVCGP